jgi:hypothetical protein
MSDQLDPIELGDVPAADMDNETLAEATLRSAWRVKELMDEYQPTATDSRQQQRDRIYLEMGKLLAGVSCMGERLDR